MQRNLFITTYTMAYIPPHLRTAEMKAAAEAERNARSLDMNDKNFPTLGGGGGGQAASSLNRGSFAAKAAEWEETRKDLEYKQRVELEKQKIRQERIAREKFEEDRMRDEIAARRSYKSTNDTPYVAPLKEGETPDAAPTDEWTSYVDPKKGRQRRSLAKREASRAAQINKTVSSGEDSQEDEDGEDGTWNEYDQY
jgi:hypothetical protein